MLSCLVLFHIIRLCSLSGVQEAHDEAAPLIRWGLAKAEAKLPGPSVKWFARAWTVAHSVILRPRSIALVDVCTLKKFLVQRNSYTRGKRPCSYLVCVKISPRYFTCFARSPCHLLPNLPQNWVILNLELACYRSASRHRYSCLIMIKRRRSLKPIILTSSRL